MADAVQQGGDGWIGRFDEGGLFEEIDGRGMRQQRGVVGAEGFEALFKINRLGGGGAAETADDAVGFIG